MLAVAEAVRTSDEPRSHPHLTDSLHVLTCGSVDDGKSTLIGRLLWDSGTLHADEQQAVLRAPRTAAGTPDFSRLVDGLAAEREQGITIDIAWRYLDSGTRRIVIIDGPGHEQYTRNMATGASHADVAILLVDARNGIKTQTRRHAAILHLMGVGRVVLAVNKMDLVGWSHSRFRVIEREFLGLAQHLGFVDATAIPVSAVLGHNVTERASGAPWYAGPTLLDALQRMLGRQTHAGRAFRFPVQLVVRSGTDFRGLAGTVTSGEIAVGGEVLDAATARHARVRRIVVMGRDLPKARAGQAVVLQLDTDLDISRGAVLASPGHVPAVVQGLEARLVWLADVPFDAQRAYLLRTATDLVPISVVEVRAHLDLAAFAEHPIDTCTTNDIAIARIDLTRGAAVDLFAEQRETGSFILIDAISGATVAAGIVTALHDERPQHARTVFHLTRDLIKRGLAADLSDDAASETELRRRANEAAILLRAAGVPVQLEDGLG